jgi:3-hydroxybutyryl-CoA dehydratase
MPTLENFTFDELTVGDQANTERTLTEKDLILFAAASGDINPIHLDADYAAKTPFKQRIAHGIWSGSLISAAIATVLPGPGSVYLGQSLKFLRPVVLDDTLQIALEVLSKNERKKSVELKCTVTNQHGKAVVKGIADVLAPTEKQKLECPLLPQISVN